MGNRYTRDFVRLCTELLTLIEIEEAKLLNWGFFDVRNNLDESLPTLLQKFPVDQIALWKRVQEQGYTFHDVLAYLKDQKLIFRFTIAGQSFYRSRFAEIIRLLSLLRQRFSYNDWQTASRLVSDIKIQLQRRRYPRRDIEPKMLLEALKKSKLPHSYLNAIDTLLRDEQGEYLQLARFQQEAILQQMRYLRSRGEHGLVIGAGTGSGKTKAFYIPALAEIASKVTNDPYVYAIALYPRVELLKDQLREAFAEARKLDDYLNAAKRKGISIGAYYGDTPQSAGQFLAKPPESWKGNTTRDGWICPFFSCPRCQSQELTWYRRDLEREDKDNQKGIFGRYARLICPNPNCRYEVEGEHLLFTREQMIHQPPDILFTTTEMLNRRLSRTKEHHLFGLSPSHHPPRLVLLDEIHTYEGVHGAQTAYTLRRWKYVRELHHTDNLCIVGLSATLMGASEFFSKLTGIPVHQVMYVTPHEEDLIEEGVEYNVVLKGDPVSGTSLLSTSVQTVMLLGRMQDPDSIALESTLYGKKIFSFADKLDVLNRWYHIAKEAEEENTLSKFRDYHDRSVSPEMRRALFQSGQEWVVCHTISKHSLKSPLRLDLTSSQYRGVDAQANFILATSTLEVGFNDPAVGMVVQHKAPRSMASFLQRKGRAGRQRHMRPWMVVVTSAYGRDRWAFQHTEQLFSPQLEAINLPLDNYYVRKIQAAYALMDWLAYTLCKEQRVDDVDVWDALSSDDRGKVFLQQSRRALRTLLDGLLRGRRLDDFQHYLQNALGLPDEISAQLLLWAEPRSLLFEVIPTVLRQLESNWQTVIQGKPVEWTDTISKNPMPDFVPPNLFSDLNLPELQLRFIEKPVQTRAAKVIPKREDQFLPLLQAIHEFAPGHVNKRYARKQYTDEAHWLALPVEEKTANGLLDLQDLHIEKSEFPQEITVNQQLYLLYQPRAYALSPVPAQVKNTSTGRLIWRSSFIPRRQHETMNVSVLRKDGHVDNGDSWSTSIKLSPDSLFHSIFPTVECYTQVTNSWVEVTRMAIGVYVETRFKRGPEQKRHFSFVTNNERAALGFSIYADALCFTFADLSVDTLRAHSNWPRLYTFLAPEYFLYKIQNDARLNGQYSSFELEWLWQLAFSMITATAVARQNSLQDAAIEVRGNRTRLAERALSVIFQSQQTEVAEDDERNGRLQLKLLEMIGNAEVQTVLDEQEQVLWNDDDSAFSSWLQQCYASSLGSVLFAALLQLLPDVDAESLIMDVDGNNIWISETVGGGVGIISRLADVIALHPGDFDLQMLDTVQFCEREELAGQLRVITRLLEAKDPELLSIFSQLRSGMDLPRQTATRRSLMHVLEHHGLPATRQLIVALNAKFLRPNSANDTDILLADMVRIWHEEELRLGCEIDLRVMAVAALRIPTIKDQVVQVLHRIGGSQIQINESQVFNLLQSLLWLNCHNSCPDCIQTYSPYQQLVKPSRALLKILMKTDEQTVLYGQPEWKQLVQHMLSTSYRAQVACSPSLLEACKVELLAILTEQVEIGVQFYFPVIERLALEDQRWVITLIIQEFAHA